jgi:hypothetical protein
MKDLIDALTIFSKYVEPDSYQANFPTHCEHDVLFVNVEPDLVSEEDKAKLEKLSFIPNDVGFNSYRFGSC